MLTPEEIKEQIPHTWPLFFARHGQFTTVQRQTIPFILNGRDILVISATATGKTEAVIAPLLERHWSQLRQSQLTILYVCPTRALVNDLYGRLYPALSHTGIKLTTKTGDTGPINATRPPAFLITTPESLDSLLTRMPRLFVDLQAIVLDEIHLFDNTPRGDQVRCLLPRLETIRQYARPEVPRTQRIALSATVPHPAGVASRYLHESEIVVVPGGRPIEADVAPLYDLGELRAALAQRAVQKSLIFCNSREQVEQTAAYLRQHLPHHAEIFVHYSNLDSGVRREVETRFAAAAVAICVCTSTLELGIDIGTVDDVVLLGAPPNLTSFLQRIGRGGRRATQTRVLCMPRSPQEWARFEALLTLANRPPVADRRPPTGDSRPLDEKGPNEGPTISRPSAVSRQSSAVAASTIEDQPADVEVYGFRPSVLVQQIFSLIKQSPTGSVRLADLRRIAPVEVTSEDIRQIVSHLSFARYLRAGRPGEWKPDVELQELIDRHEIYSNIGGDTLAATAVDAFTGNVIVQTERAYDKGMVLLFGGRLMKVLWREKNRFGLATVHGENADEILRPRREYAAIPFIVTQTVARSLGLQLGQMATLPADDGMWLFHFWGTIWGRLLTNVLVDNLLSAEPINEYCLLVRPSITQLPPWDEKLARKAAMTTALALADQLEMGRFHSLLPAHIGVAAVVRLLNLEQFGKIYRATRLISWPEIYEPLHALV
jgi:ATP-dependent Lhr-like helicase